MIITPTDLKYLYPKFDGEKNEVLAYKLESIENAIREYTNNNFQVRSIRDLAFARGNQLLFDDVPVFKVNDTIQLSKSGANDGVYVVQSVEGNAITIDKELYCETVCFVTLVKYPSMVIQGAINILDWDCFKRDKVGVASETISRHAVSYQQYDGTNTISGYPSMLFGFCTPFMRAKT